MLRISILRAASPAQENFRDLPTGRNRKLEGHPARQENLRKGHSDFGLQENFRDSHSRRNRKLEFRDGIPNDGLTFSIFLPSGTPGKFGRMVFKFPNSMVKFQTSVPRISIWRAASPAQENFRDLPTGRHRKLEGHPARQENLRKGHSDFGLHDGIPNKHCLDENFASCIPRSGKFPRLAQQEESKVGIP